MTELKVTDEDKNVISVKSNHTHNLIIGNTSAGKSYLYQILERSIKIELNGNPIKLDNIIYLMEDKFLGGITPNIFYQSYEDLKDTIKELDIKLIVLDDFGIPEVSSSIKNLVSEYSDICIIYMFRDFTLNLKMPIKKFVLSDKDVKLVDYLTVENIEEINNCTTTADTYELIATEDKNKDKKRFSGFLLWKNSKELIERFYSIKINRIEGEDSVYKLADKLQNTETLNSSLLAIDIVYDNYAILQVIKDSLNYVVKKECKIISILTAEQHYLLSNINSIKKFNLELGNIIEHCIRFKQDIQIVYPVIEPYCKLQSQKLDLNILNSEKTQEKKYKALLQIMRWIRDDEDKNIITTQTVDCSNLLRLENSDYAENFNSDTNYFI
jgi:hypothetical protein